MNILLISDDMLVGGVTRHVTDIANSLYDQYRTVTVAATKGNACDRLDKKVNFIPLHLKYNNTFANNYFGFIPSYLKLHYFIKTNKIDVIHSHKRYSHALGKILSKQFKIPHITTYHTVFTDKQYLSVFGDITVCICAAIKKSLIYKWNRPIETLVTIHNGIAPFRKFSISEMHEVRKAFQIPEKNIVIGSVGHFVWEKDRVTLLRSAYELKKTFDLTNVSILLIGFGPQKQMLQNLCFQLKLDDVIKFIDGNSSIEALCNISDFMILNSIIEGFPLILLEAASIAKPFIASDAGGVSEFIESNRTGILIPQKDPQALADAMKYLIGNRSEQIRLGLNAKIKYEANFQYDRFIQEMIDTYNRVLET